MDWLEGITEDEESKMPLRFGARPLGGGRVWPKGEALGDEDDQKPDVRGRSERSSNQPFKAALSMRRAPAIHCH